MNPAIIHVEWLYIAGVTGDGAKTGEVWAEFDGRYNAAAFNKLSENAYEVRFDYDGKCECHVGYSVEENSVAEGFVTLALPPCGYAVFEVYVAKGYDSENKAMEEWLRGNENYAQSFLEGKPFVVECYNEKYKGGNMPDSIVEIWVPVRKK